MHIITKQEARASALCRRKSIDAAQRAALSQKIAEHALCYARAQGAKTVFLYAAAREEAETRWLTEQLLQADCTVCLPKCEGGGVMQAFQIESLAQTAPGRFGILEPTGQRLVPPEAISLAFVPGCAFGQDGSRLGYGGGYYDRFLPQCCAAKFVGLCFAACLAETLPREATDVLMHAVITENGVMNIL